MPSSLKFLYKKGKPKLSKKKNKIYSRAKRRGNRHVDRRMLDNMLSPVVSVSKKDYGYSTVFDDSAATSDDLPDMGTLSSLQCLPGRQIYLEFMAMPVRAYSTTHTGITQSTYRRTWSFLELLYLAYRRNRWINQQTNQVAEPDDFTLQVGGVNYNVPNLVFNGATGDQVVSSTNDIAAWVENTVANSAFNFKFQYMGGHQTHKFQNTTTLPIHGEIREFLPRQPMNFDNIKRTVGITNLVDCQKVPGMWQTLYADLRRIHNRETNDTDAGGSKYNSAIMEHGLYDEIDDRNFKFKPGCEETTFRWVVGPVQKFTIYPGETFTYKMVIPPFAGDSFQFIKNVNRSWWQGAGATSANLRSYEFGNTPVFVPGFTKFCQIRMIGSRAYKAARYNDNNEVYNANYVNDANNNAYTGTDAPNPSHNIDRPIMHVATHSCRVTHTMTEHHSMRTFPTFDGRIHLFTDNTANAENGADITRLEQMAYIDPMELQEEAPVGDA